MILAQRSGLAETTINEIETGKRTPRPSTLRRLAAALGTEDWNLHNPAGFSTGLMQEAVQALERLGKVSRENAINGSHGRDFVTEFAGSFVDDAGELDELRSDVKDALELLIPAWLELRARCSATLTHEETQVELNLLEGALPFRVREWEELGIPSEVAGALLHAELEELRAAVDRQ